jgi:hypothetical protein
MTELSQLDTYLARNFKYFSIIIYTDIIDSIVIFLSVLEKAILVLNSKLSTLILSLALSHLYKYHVLQISAAKSVLCSKLNIKLITGKIILHVTINVHLYIYRHMR